MKAYLFLQYLFHEENESDYGSCFDMVRNIQSAMNLLRYSERYSGIKRAVIASCFGDEKVSVRKIASILKVYRGERNGERKGEEGMAQVEIWVGVAAEGKGGLT